MALINCPKCGKQISDRAIKCPHCGHIPAPSQEAQLTLSSEPQQQESAPRKKWWIILVVVAGIAAVLALLWFFNNNEDSVNVSETHREVPNHYPSPNNKTYSGRFSTARASLAIDGNGRGSYTYDCNGTDLTRNIQVTSYNEQTGLLLIKSYDKSGNYIGRFEGYIGNRGSYSGTFTNYKGDRVDFYFEANDIGN